MNCKICRKIIFKILDGNNNFVSILEKNNKNCFDEFVDDSNFFGIDFNQEMDWEKRTLLLSLVFFINYVMF